MSLRATDGSRDVPLASQGWSQQGVGVGVGDMSETCMSHKAPEVIFRPLKNNTAFAAVKGPKLCMYVVDALDYDGRLGNSDKRLL